ncbi:MAG: AEC family transporter [Jannaschia sp.]
MLAIFLKTIPFFALIALGYAAGRTRFFTPEATAYLTKFVFYFALSAMLFSFAANLTLAEIFDLRFITAYLWGCGIVYLIATAVGLFRGLSVAECAVEAQVATIGNVGFLGIPMFILLLGPASAGPMLMVLATDLIVFSSLIVILITGSREGRISARTLRTVGGGLVKNPMIVSITAGILWSATGRELWAPVNEFVSILGAAATPGALFAIGASLAGKTAERMSVAGWLTFCKLVLHPAAVALSALVLFPVADPFAATVMISAAALPVAGNVYMLAQHYGVAPQRVSAAILVSTAISIVTVSAIVGLLTGGTS